MANLPVRRNAEKQRPGERLTDRSEVMAEAETRTAANRPVRSTQRRTDAENCKQTSNAEKQRPDERLTDKWEGREAETSRAANRPIRNNRGSRNQWRG
jgi:hypothetical protein